jgi:hypothetical protein
MSAVHGQVITTIAGVGLNGYSGDGGPATDARISIPGHGVFDKDGNFYFNQRSTHRVRKITPTGIISTFAGIGIAGYNGDNIPATDAKFDNPLGISIDRHDNIYISDASNHRLRKIDRITGLISTVAGNGSAGFTGNGGQATAASLNLPSSVCVDTFGNIYINDYFNYRIRKVNATIGIITTVAGNSNYGYSSDGGLADTTRINFAFGIATDKANNLYIADVNNYRIRKVDAVTGIMSTVAGNGSGIYTGENVPALSEGIHPFDIAFDKNGTLFFADQFNSRIRKIASFGLIVTVAGNGTNGFGGDGGPATNAKLYNPEGLAIDTCGNLYIGDGQNNRIRKVTLNPTCEPITSVNTVKANDANFTISPNPTSSTITLTSTEKINTLSITNAVGEVVSEQHYAGKEQVEVNVAHLPRGMYMVRVNGVYVRRFLKE